MLAALFASASLVSISALLVVDLMSWRRAAPLRSGSSEGAAEPSWCRRSSRTTYLAAASGAAIAVTGMARSPPSLPSLALAALGIGIVFAGLWARVAALEADDRGLTIRYAGRAAYRLAWDGCEGLVPPRWPTGGWRICGHGRGRTLMPSDVLGNEGFLRVLLVRSELSFDGRRWVATRTRISP